MVNNWKSYKEWISDSINAGSQFYFRGQRKQEWKLQTSFHRYSDKSDITMLKYLDYVIPEVHYNVCSVQDEIVDITNEIQFGSFMARLQHHGFPTPLLDWTLSPYIAAYFAFKDLDPYNPDTDSVSIYIFDIHSWSTTFEQPLNLRDSTRFVSAMRPYAKNNPRLSRQQAVTTATNISDLGEYLIRKGKESSKTFLYHVTLPVSERRMVMNELNLMGINSMTMFPDFDGVCLSMKEHFFHNVETTVSIPAPPTVSGA